MTRAERKEMVYAVMAAIGLIAQVAIMFYIGTDSVIKACAMVDNGNSSMEVVIMLGKSITAAVLGILAINVIGRATNRAVVLKLENMGKERA